MEAQKTLCTCKDKLVILNIDFKIDVFVDVNKYLKQIKFPKSLHTCASYTELPSNKGTRCGKESKIHGNWHTKLYL